MIIKLKPELIFYGGHKLTEAPLYDNKNKLLYFLAIRYNTIFSLNTETLAVNSFMTDGPVGGIAFRNGELTEAEKNGIYCIDFKKKTKKKIAHIITYDKMRYNHIISDTRGRLIVDVMGDEDRCEGRGGLYCLDGGKCTCLIYGTTVANGVCLDKDETKLFFTDTPAQAVYMYDYDSENGTVSNPEEIIRYEGAPRPDGLCIDDEGFLYVTEWAGSKIDVLSILTKRKEDELNFPCKHITACCKVGTSLYVTTAKSGEEGELPYAGGIFKVTC